MNLIKTNMPAVHKFIGKSEATPVQAGGDIEKKRIQQLDGLRAIAVLMVIFFHYLNNQYIGAPVNKAESILMKVTSVGWSGVDLFFILSGFLIGSILLKNRDSKNFFRTFYVRRFLRIIPIYYVLLAIFFSIQLTSWFVADATIFQNPIPLWNFLTFTQNFVMGAQNHFGPGALTPTWSLAVEEQFYLAIPLIVYFVRNKYLPYVIVGLIGIAVISRSLATNWYQEYTLLPCRIDSPILGFCIAYLLQYDNVVRFIRKNLLRFQLGLMFIGVPLFAAFYYRSGYFNHTLIALFFAVVLLIVRFSTKGWLYRTLTWHPFLLIGRYSYFIYLYHLLVLGLMQLHILGNKKPLLYGMNEYLVSLAALLITYALSVISFRYFEKPLINYSHTYKY
jgi:peptidoglycan/LPS O-acetylase OafA/YrhL